MTPDPAGWPLVIGGLTLIGGCLLVVAKWCVTGTIRIFSRLSAPSGPGGVLPPAPKRHPEAWAAQGGAFDGRDVESVRA